MSPIPIRQNRVAAIRQALRYHNVIIAPITSKVPDVGTAPAECAAALAAFLNQRGIFASVQLGAPVAVADTLAVEGEIQDVRIVSGAARVWGGALAGNSYMHIKVVIREASTGRPVFERLVQSENNAYAAAWTMGSNDRSLPSDVGQIVAELLIKVAQGVTPPPAE